jgi:hypothetical protein
VCKGRECVRKWLECAVREGGMAGWYGKLLSGRLREMFGANDMVFEMVICLLMGFGVGL